MGINYKTDTHQAKKPVPLLNPGKYKSSRPPMYKSEWEAKVFRAMDINPYVIERIEIYFNILRNPIIFAFAILLSHSPILSSKLGNGCRGNGLIHCIFNQVLCNSFFIFSKSFFRYPH